MYEIENEETTKNALPVRQNHRQSLSSVPSNKILPEIIPAISDQIFHLDKVQFQFPSSLLFVTVVNNILIVAVEGTPSVNADHAHATKKNTGLFRGLLSAGEASIDETNVLLPRILRIDLGQAASIEEFEIKLRQKNDKIRKLFLDPTTNHLIISTELADNYYLNAKWKKPKLLSRFRGVLIESIAWSKQFISRIGFDCRISTGVFLVGSRQGRVYEVEIHALDDYWKREDRFFRQVYSFNENDTPVLGLEYEIFPTDSSKCIIFATTKSRMYQFIGFIHNQSIDIDSGIGVFDDLFRSYDTNPSYQEIPGSESTNSSVLRFWNPFVNMNENGICSLPSMFAWLTSPGIYHGNLVFGNQSMNDSIVENSQLLPYPNGNKNPAPISIALTEFHFLLLYKDRLVGLCLLNHSVVYDERIPLEPGEVVLGLSVDVLRKTYWVYTTFSLYEVLVENEDRDVWKMYLEKKSFEDALMYAKNPRQKDEIFSTQADYYFQQKKYNLSATFYARSNSVGFEQVVLKYMDRGEKEALKVFLLRKLEEMKKTDVIQNMLICTWLVEMFINGLNSEENELNRLIIRRERLSMLEEEEENLEEVKSKVSRLETKLKENRGEFRGFLHSYQDQIDKPTTFNLLSSHGNIQDYLYFAEIIRDYEKVIDFNLSKENWDAAINVLASQTSLDLYYKYSPLLIEKSPNEIVSAWIQHPNLNPRHLIPALLKYRHEFGTTNQAIRYLLYCIENLQNTDSVVHNFLISLYVKNSKNEDELLMFLNSQKESPHFDPQYVLRLCHEQGLTQSCILMYSAMEMYEQAVDLSLKHNDLELARINADRPEDDESLKKRLWLKIARYLVEDRKDIKYAMNFLKQCDLLKIEDVLTFFPDFVLIDDFKEEIQNALEEYNIHIEDLKSEMNEATKSAESIRLDIRQLKNKYAVIPSNQKCDICSTFLLSRQFYLFPCKHFFHADCLTNFIIEDMNPRYSKRIIELQNQITTHHRSSSSSPRTSTKFLFTRGTNKKKNDDKSALTVEDMKEELDELVSSECVFCGELMIKSVDKPFITPNEIAAWAL